MVDRQIDYYLNVLIRMRLCTYSLKEHTIALTEQGVKIFNMTSVERLQAMAEIVFSNKIFNDALIKGIDKVSDRDFGKRNIAKSSIPRRTQTVKSWLTFFKENC